MRDSKKAMASLLCLVALAAVGCQNQNVTESVLPNPTSAIKVNVFQPVKTENTTKTVSYFGSIEPNRRQTLGFGIGGKLFEVPNDQQRFAKGAVLATLEQAGLIERRDAVDAEIKNVPDAVRGDGRSRQLQEQLKSLNQQIQARTILAPFDCVVEQSFASQNSLIAPNAPVLSVVETANPKIEVNLPRRIANLVTANQEFSFLLDSKTIFAVLGDRAFTENPPGTIKMSFDVRSDLTTSNFYLGQTVEARFVFPTPDSGYWLPLSSLRKNSNGLWSVFVVQRNRNTELDEEPTSLVKQQIVEIVRLRDEEALVSSELKNAFVVQNGLHRIVPGQTVVMNVVAPEKATVNNDAGATGAVE